MGGDGLPFLPLFLSWAAAQKLAVHCIRQRCSPSVVLPATVPHSQSATATVVTSTTVAEKAAVLAVRHIMIPMAHSCTYGAASHALNHS